jgi:hypothetical protein
MYNLFSLLIFVYVHILWIRLPVAPFVGEKFLALSGVTVRWVSSGHQIHKCERNWSQSFRMELVSQLPWGVHRAFPTPTPSHSSQDMQPFRNCHYVAFNDAVSLSVCKHNLLWHCTCCALRRVLLAYRVVIVSLVSQVQVSCFSPCKWQWPCVMGIDIFFPTFP